MPVSANTVPMASHTDRGRSALSTPSGIPSMSQITTAPAVSDSVRGNATRIVSSTGCWLT